MPVIIHCWKGDYELPLDHGNVVAGIYPPAGGWLITRDDAVQDLDLALKMAGYDPVVAELRAAIAEDEEAAMITVNESLSLPTSGVPPLRARRARQS